MDAPHRGLHTPLLTDEEVSGSIRPSHAPLEPQEQETDAKHFVRAPSIILGLLFLEITAFHGVYLNLVVYLQQVLHGDNASNAANVSTWAAASYLMPLFGAALADSCLGKYKTSLLCLCIFLAGLVIVTASATLPSFRPPPCDQSTYCVPATTAQSAVFFSGIYLCAIGCGGVKSTLLSFGAEQFHDDDRDKNPRERERKASYFSCYYAIANLGILTAGTVLVWIEDRVSWGLGYGVCASCIALALVGFAAGTPTYRILLPAGGPFKSAVQVLVASLRKASLRAPVDASLLDVEDVKTVT